MYYGNEDLGLAVDSFEQVISEQGIPESLYLSTLYSLAQLSMQRQDYSKAEYWLQLGVMYGEINQEDKQLAVMEAAWQAGYITKSADVLTLAQLCRFYDVPFKAAKLLQKAIDNGVVTAQVKHLALLAQAYIAAKDDEKAIPVLIKAASISDNGQFDGQLAQAYLNVEQGQTLRLAMLK